MIPLLALFCLSVCVLLAGLAEAIRGLDPETLALPDEVEDGAGPIAQVTGRFRAAETQLRAGAIMALGGAAFLAGRLAEGAAATVILVLGSAAAGVVVGLLVPEALVRGREAAVLGRSARAVLLLASILRPAVAVQSWIATVLSALAGSQPTAAEPPPPPVPGAPAAGPPEGALEKVLAFASAVVEEVMTPRAEMVVVESGAPVERVAGLVRTTRHGRYPLYRGTLDEVIGAVAIRDLLAVDDPQAPADDRRRELAVVPESKSCWELAVEMRASGEAMALVVDEFGAVSGLVTGSDLLAELVGEIAEEGEPAPLEYQRVDRYTWILHPFLKIERVNELTGIGLPDGDYQTLSGFILTSLGHIPPPRERLRWGDGEFEILVATPRRIELVRLRRARGRRRGRPPAAAPAVDSTPTPDP